MIDQLQWFLAVLLVIAGAVAIGGVVWAVIWLCEGGIRRARQSRLLAMPERIRKGA